ncbi:MAG: TetR/AcrR family transcriptional regulator [Bacteroidia bacterium]|jgi:AcrR family transcriptional regulator|nr:TetR/AcrR family transcriptional regulator [Bacteroidia bacterium]
MTRQTSDTEKKLAILDATLRLIRNNGFHNAPMSQVAKEAGVGTGTIYHHFVSKESIIAALYAQQKELMGRALMRGDKPGDNYRERFFRFWMNLYKHFVNHPDGFLFLEQYSNSPYITGSTRQDNEHFYAPVVAFITQGVKNGILRNMDPELLVALIYGNITTCVKLHLSGQIKMNPARLKQAAQATWDGVKID